MSFKPEKELSLAGISLNNKSSKQIQNLFQQVLKRGIHGLCYSAYEEGQEPGDVLNEQQIIQRMKIIAPHTKWIRSFSCIEGNELIPKVAKNLGLKTMVGVWLGKDKSLNEKEIEGLITLAKNDLVDIAVVGNEVMYRNDLSEEELLAYIKRVKEMIPNVQVGYVDAYYEFSQRPRITEACDVILANCYPFWEGCDIDYSLIYMKQMYQEALEAGKGKKVIITETGWPSRGRNINGAFPGKENALRYFVNAQRWSQKEDIDMFYFSSFDESWKTGDEGDLGAYWGLWDKDGQLKYS